jgi:hypothetical protein
MTNNQGDVSFCPCPPNSLGLILLLHIIQQHPIIQIANIWLVFNKGGGPTDDKPAVTLRAPQNLSEVSNFMIIRMANIWTYYEEW